MPPLKAQLLLAESLAAYFPEMVFTDSGITVQIHRNTQKNQEDWRLWLKDSNQCDLKGAVYIDA